MGYKFNPATYQLTACANCGGELEKDDVTRARVTVNGENREVPALYVCKACAHVPAHVEAVDALRWLITVVVPQGYAYASGVADDGKASPAQLMAALMILQDARDGEALAHDLAVMTGGGKDGEEATGTVLAAVLDLRREDDGKVSYRCPNSACGGRHELAEVADSLPLPLVASLVGSLPE